jgi:N-methylhydantoinase B
MDAVQLSIFSNRIDAICSEMGVTLQHAAFSPNIRDRLDYSCAIFDETGELCAQAAHIPVHLGSMAYAMRDLAGRFDWREGYMVVLNDPYKGGTHLPDVTLIAPVFINNELSGFVANRAHHADIGSDTPGSMPLSTCLQEEGLVIEPCLLVRDDEVIDDIFCELMSSMRNPQESTGDFIAQVAANRRGVQRLISLIGGMGLDSYRASLDSLNDYARRLASRSLADIPDGCYHFEDFMDGDGVDGDGVGDDEGGRAIAIRVAITVAGEDIHVDFSGTSPQVNGNINCPISVTAAAVYYVFRCLMPPQTPACAGSFAGIDISAPGSSLVNATYPAAVAAGNVETSTRIVDVVLGALSRVIPERIPAASHGSMNNLAMGSAGDVSHAAWDYYETIGGGMGASQVGDGLDAVQTHMTNTLNTPIESLEMMYPLRIIRYALRTDSAGRGRHDGGEGVHREYQFLQDARFTLLTERRIHAPWGLAGGGDARRGENLLNGQVLPGKVSRHVRAGDVLTISTPGGGGYGKQA